MASLDEIVRNIVFHLQQNRPLLPMYLHLICAALFPIYTGAHASLSRPSSAAKPLTKPDKDELDDEDEEETVQKMEGLTPQDAIMFPITAAVVLAGLYWAIKSYGADVINTFLGLYFSLIGTYSVGKLINDSWTTISTFVYPAYYRDDGRIWRVSSEHRKAECLDDGEGPALRSSPLAGVLGRIPIPEPLLALAWSLRIFFKEKFQVTGYAKNSFDFKVVLTRHNVCSGFLGLVAIAYAQIDKPWWLTNLQGFAVSYGALQMMSPTTFATGTLILSALFFYDIWAVFFTPLMVTVAKNLDVPIKLVFPRPAEASSEPGVTQGRSYSMLGLGDIVLPGLMIALALRFDLYMFYLRKQTKVNKEHCEGDMCVLREEVEKAPYTTVTGHWGEKFWTGGIPHSVLPKHLSTRFPKPYFTASMCGYVVGMVATLAFMTVFKHAQPALLYLVPCVLISTWGTGLVRGELKEMWGFSEAITAEADDEQETPIEDKAKESRGIFAEVWNELFGSRDHSKDKEVDEAKPSEPASMERKFKHDPTSLFTFTISRHGRSTNTNENSETQETDQGAGDNNKSQINVSQDFASIGEDEMDKPSSLRYRAVSTQQGTVEKHQRLS